jgi:DNA-binding NarL/FixJ family response regulator
MTIFIYSQSDSYKSYLRETLKQPVEFFSDLDFSKTVGVTTHIVHASSFPEEAVSRCLNDNQYLIDHVVIAEDSPTVENMLSYTHMGVRGYCNGYMDTTYYEQLSALVNAGQSWYPPELLAEALTLAHGSISQAPDKELLKVLTPREKQIAMSVAEGNSNKVIARRYDITERTVKAHLTHIYKKLSITDRLGLVIYLKRLDAA